MIVSATTHSDFMCSTLSGSGHDGIDGWSVRRAHPAPRAAPIPFAPRPWETPRDHRRRASGCARCVSRLPVPGLIVTGLGRPGTGLLFHHPASSTPLAVAAAFSNGSPPCGRSLALTFAHPEAGAGVRKGPGLRASLGSGAMGDGALMSESSQTNFPEPTSRNRALHQRRRRPFRTSHCHSHQIMGTERMESSHVCRRQPERR